MLRGTTKKKISDTLKSKYRTGVIVSARKGKLLSEETKIKISLKNTGLTPWNKGLTKETNLILKQSGDKISTHHKRWMNNPFRLMIKEKNPQWQGGKSYELYPAWYWKIRQNILARDRVCQICLSPEKLCVHHIDYDKQNKSSLNLITLCRKCHNRTNTNRGYWKNYFSHTKMLSNRVENSIIQYSFLN